MKVNTETTVTHLGVVAVEQIPNFLHVDLDVRHLSEQSQKRTGLSYIQGTAMKP